MNYLTGRLKKRSYMADKTACTPNRNQEQNMSFGHLIITPQPCPVLTQTRGETFSLIQSQNGQHIYFRFCEGTSYTERLNEQEAVLTEQGADFLRKIGSHCGNGVIFADVLLLNRESVEDFAATVLKQLAADNTAAIQAEPAQTIKLRQAYRLNTGLSRRNR